MNVCFNRKSWNDMGLHVVIFQQEGTAGNEMIEKDDICVI